MSAEENMERMQTLDDAWNTRTGKPLTSGTLKIPPSIGPVSQNQREAATIIEPKPSSSSRPFQTITLITARTRC